MTQPRSKPTSKPIRKSRQGTLTSPSSKAVQTTAIANLLRLGTLLAEKCEIKEANEVLLQALDLARVAKDFKSLMEAIALLLRLAGEGLNAGTVAQWDQELDRFMAKYPKHIPAIAWYCKGAIAEKNLKYLEAQRFFHKYITVINEVDASDRAKGWCMLARILLARKRYKRATWLAETLLRSYESQKIHGINGVLYLIIGRVHEEASDLDAALEWYQKAHSAFLEEHNWYSYLYVLKSYARISRLKKHYAQAYWYLELIDKAVSAPELAGLKKDVELERDRLQEDAVDLLIDTQKGMVTTRENGEVLLGKQYVLLNILEALFHAHSRDGRDQERGLSKAEIIEAVWGEPYRPEAHDNKLYYNINRLRKLIEPDVRKPRYLLNWREGYRLAPGLRVQIQHE